VLAELSVSNLGVIDDLSLLLGPGMTAVTGETGAGKTLITDAIALLIGAKSDIAMVRPGTAEAEVNGRFLADGGEFIVRRVVPTDGRSRAYIDDRPASQAVLSARSGSLVDVHGQHLHQSLARGTAQRGALDRFGNVDLSPLTQARALRRQLEEELESLGGDAEARAREVDLVSFQVAEIEGAALSGPDEEEALEAEEAALAGSEQARVAALETAALLSADGAGGDALARSLTALAGHPALAALQEQLSGALAEVADVASGLRSAVEQIDAEPERLAQVVDRRQLITELKRKYGPGLADVIEFGEHAQHRLSELERHDEVAARLQAQLDDAIGTETAAAEKVGKARRKAAPKLARDVEEWLTGLALPNARVGIDVGGDPGDAVEFRLSVNSGAPLLPLARVASGGELSRAMLALQLVSSTAPPTVVFDEVDAGVGGEAATAVGRALSKLAEHHQVLVVTHLPQVAAFADQHICVTKSDDGDQVFVAAAQLDEPARVVEISRMLSGSPDSATAQLHAEELLDAAR
jgi:DNA repair protein RecN (Recombination protein N)